MTANGGELPEDRAKTVEAGLALFQQVQAERDALREELRETREIVTRQQVEIDSLHNLHNMLESHIQSYMLQRDEAVAQRAAYETLFATVQAQLRVFNLPATPLVKDHGPEDAAYRRDADLLPKLPNQSGSGQRAAVHDERAGAGKMAESRPVLAHEESLLGHRPDRPRPPGDGRHP